jgi:S1-C subfamily serine protease
MGTLEGRVAAAMRRGLAALVAVVLVWPALAVGAVATSRIDPTLLKAVVRIIVKKSNRSFVGTGFVVSRAPEDRPDERSYYLVTNKHVIGDWNVFDADFREYVETLEVTFFRDGAASPPVAIRITDARGALDVTAVRPHHNPVVDVVVIALTQDVLGFSPSTLVSFDLSYMLRSSGVTTLLAGLGDQVFAVGYPKGVSSHTMPYPIAKVGYLATQPGPSLTFDVRGENRLRKPATLKLTGTLLLVDGLVLPGNSGGPVIVPTDLKFRRNPTTNALEVANLRMKNLVVGIVSFGLNESSGLTLIYGADYIVELVEELDQLRRSSVK